MPSKITEWLDNKLYPKHEHNWDNKLFRQHIMGFISEGQQDILDVGAGAGIVTEMNFRDVAKSVTGIDPDERVLENPYLDKAAVGLGESMPFDSNSFDIVFSDNVLEHLPNPDKVFKEIIRVLKPGGVFLGKTPNKYHYMPLISAMTPHRFHQWFNKKRGRDSEDTFPTTYLANSPGQVKRLARSAGLEVEEILLVEGRPEYLRFTPVAYILGYMYERMVNLIPLLRRFRILLVIKLKKPL